MFIVLTAIGDNKVISAITNAMTKAIDCLSFSQLVLLRNTYDPISISRNGNIMLNFASIPTSMGVAIFY